MKKIQLFLLFQASFGIVYAQNMFNGCPILKHYDQSKLLNIALPMGGIGTGTVSLGGRGELKAWQIMNRPGMNYSTVTPGNNAPFFSIYVKRLYFQAL